MKKEIFVVSAAAVILSCSTQVADTTSSSEVTNGYAAVILDREGQPANGTATLVYRADWYERQRAGDSVIALQKEIIDGVLECTDLNDQEYTLIVQNDFLGARRVITIDTTTDTIRLSPLTPISGRITSFEGELKKALIEGTHYAVTPDDTGTFFFQGIAGTEATVIAGVSVDGNTPVPSFAKGVEIEPGNSVDLDQLQVQPEAILLDDFNDGDRSSILGWCTGHGLWYAYDDSEKGGNSTLIPSTTVADPASAITETDAWQGKSMSVSFVMGDGIESPYGSIACQLTNSQSEYTNLSDFETLRFRAKGKGMVRINFISHAVDSYEPTLIRGDFGVTIDLPTEWTEIDVPVAHLFPEPGSPAIEDNLLWSDVSDSVRAIVFGSWNNTPGDTVTLMLDDIRLEGLDPAVFQR